MAVEFANKFPNEIRDGNQLQRYVSIISQTLSQISDKIENLFIKDRKRAL